MTSIAAVEAYPPDEEPGVLYIRFGS